MPLSEMGKKVVGNRAKNDLCSAVTGRTCWRLTRTSPYSPASNRRNPVVSEVDAPELSS